MSIVEKALNKARGERTSGFPRTEQAPESAATLIVPAARAEPHPETPERSITLDIAAMRANGLLAPQAHAARVQHDVRRVKWPLLEIALRRSATPVANGNLIMIGSSLPGEGKSFTAMNLALALAAERDCSVLLVDADIAQPKISRLLGLEDNSGLVDLLRNDAMSLRDVVLGTDVPRLSLLPAGRADLSGPELLAGQRMQRLCEELAARPTGAIVIFDSSPLLATNEAQVLSRLVGQFVMVVKADQTPPSAVKQALALVNRSAAVGVVLNQKKGGSGEFYADYYARANP